MPLQATSGAASYDAFGGGVPFEPTYIEQIFATHLYTGNGSGQTITNGIDLSTYGGLVWIKCRNDVQEHVLTDSARGVSYRLASNSTAAQTNSASQFYITSFNNNGFTEAGAAPVGQGTFVSWTFREQPKFFDVQTATTNGSSSYGSTVPSMTITHSLGSVPGCVMVKRTDGTGGWYVWHRSLPALSGLAQTATYAQLNTTGAAAIFGGNVNGTGGWIQVTATNIYLDAWFNTYEPGTFVVYIFAHDAGGFGLSGADNVISCGSFTTDGSGNATVTLGYEPQWYVIKRVDAAQSWFQLDTMRGWTATANTSKVLIPNLSNAESTVGSSPTATGFTTDANLTNANATYIYIAIRRGPMKTPTSGTSVFAPVTYTGDGTNTLDITAGFPVDMFLNSLTNVAEERLLKDRLRGGGVTLSVTETTAESTSYTIGFDSNTQILNMPSSFYSQNGVPYVDWFFRRAPGFFDVVCYTGTGSNTTQTHNLSVVPELIIVKRRNTTGAWDTYSAALSNTEYLVVNTTAAKATGATRWNSTTPTSTVFSLGTSTTTNASASTYVAYLFASCPGVSKVGSYTGTGTTKQIDCGFTGGARFVLIKRTDSTGDWYLWDSARGIVAGNDPYIVLNTQSAQVTNTDYIDTYSAGFEISSTAPAAINANGGSFVFLAIA